MASFKEIEIVIKTDGTLEINQEGWEGKTCDGAVDDIIKLLGKEVEVKRTKDWYKQQKVKINQRSL
jgi:hypothetical protein